MNVQSCDVRVFFCALIAGATLLHPCRAERAPQYIFFNIAPNRNFFYIEQGITNAFVEIPKTLHVADNPRLRIGVSFIFSTLETPTDSIEKALRTALAASEQTGVPILIALDGQNWWQSRPDLWNWWDPNLRGYNPSNVFNVEWTGWSPTNAVKISWRNWGTQCRVAPAQNIASPKVVSLQIEALQRLIPIIVQWHRQLPPDRKWLLGGVKLGWEASIGYNGYYYPNGNRYLEQSPGNDPTSSLQFDQGLSAGLSQLGYAALTSSGIKTHGTITRDDLARATAWYLEKLSHTTYDLGLPRDLIFTHQGGTGKPWKTRMPFWPAINQWSTPGWSFYDQSPGDAGSLSKDMDQSGQKNWAACEWYWAGPTAEIWEQHFARTLAYRDCRFVDIYNWTHMFERDSAGQGALRHWVSSLHE